MSERGSLREQGAIEAELRLEAERLGFQLFGVAPPSPTSHMPFYRSWLDQGHHGEMGYLAREDAIGRRAGLDATLEGVKAVVVVGHEYSGGAEDHPADRAIVARYARGRDYHRVMEQRLDLLRTWLESRLDGSVQGRICVDTAPVLERDLARRAGLGWHGRNTMLIHPGRGSYFLLGALLVDVPLVPSAPFEDDRCGTCEACLSACPTGALLGRDADGAPVMDARRCISYLTIESKGPIPRELRASIGNRVFGCDICQEVCPWNQRFGDRAGSPEYGHGSSAESLVALAERLLGMSGKAYQRLNIDTPLARPRRKGMLRNVVVAIGNAIPSASEPAPLIDVLIRALADPQALVRTHAVWALGTFLNVRAPRDVPLAIRVDAELRSLARSEQDPMVLEELEVARAAATPPSGP